VVVALALGLLAGELLWRHSTSARARTVPLPTAADLDVHFVAMVPRKLPSGWSYIGVDRPSGPDFTYMQFAHGQHPLDVMEATAGGHPSLQQSSLGGEHPAGSTSINGRTWLLYQPDATLITTTEDGVVVLLRGLSVSDEKAFAATLRRSIRTVPS
jgi:hypothetical protein